MDYLKSSRGWSDGGAMVGWCITRSFDIGVVVDGMFDFRCDGRDVCYECEC